MIRNTYGNSAKKTVRCGACGFEDGRVKREWAWHRRHEREWGTHGPIHWACPRCHAWNAYPHGRKEDEDAVDD